MALSWAISWLYIIHLNLMIVSKAIMEVMPNTIYNDGEIDVKMCLWASFSGGNRALDTISEHIQRQIEGLVEDAENLALISEATTIDSNLDPFAARWTTLGVMPPYVVVEELEVIV
jgi:hypothetical protein